MIEVNGYEIKPTMFPDKTSQVWKLPPEVIKSFEPIRDAFRFKPVKVKWTFEHEGEIMHLAQLKMLIDYYNPFVHLTMPYLPYARQDKPIANDATFALFPFCALINAMSFEEIHVVDAHSIAPKLLFNSDYINLIPVGEIMKAYRACGANLICYPDAGAVKRYDDILDLPSVHLEKIRDPSTGEIDLFIHPELRLSDADILIVDDLCDGGATFIEAAALLFNAGAITVNLYVSHGIFSKGTEVLTDAGISRIFTQHGEVK